MRKVITGKQMQRFDADAIESGTPSSVLMERAARSVFDFLVSEYDLSLPLIVCGSGNNGGDGICLAIILHNAGYNPKIWYVGEGHRRSLETDRLYNEALSLGIGFVFDPDVNSYTVIVDAILGTGMNFSPQGLILEAINAVNRAEAPVVSVDIPSGISADNGKHFGAFIKADATVTMQEYKLGHCMGEGIDASGRVVATDIGIDTSACINDGERYAYALEDSDLALIPRRRRDSHKGTFGRVLVIGGKCGMCGAVFLSALAAYRCGAGIVEVFTCESNRAILQTLIPEAIVSAYSDDDMDISLLKAALSRAAVIVLGPGLGTEDNALTIVKEVFNNAHSSLIVDADALNIVAKEEIAFPTEVPVIVTPHPGEFSRLCDLSIEQINEKPIETAVEYARYNDIICVSKNARTVVTDGENVFINMAGGPVLSKGGSGDVLTGVIAGMLCCGLSPIGAASMGVYVHSRAGDLANDIMGEYSPCARDIAGQLCHVMKKAGGKH
ncbi:MAG: NAD(P)H-hydrate dehydratase [Ruminococcaceae bacterium]|nr:NAD(P)H-hydrate dehydratase [Oscillospiraceae bacterium]